MVAIFHRSQSSQVQRLEILGRVTTEFYQRVNVFLSSVPGLPELQEYNNGWLSIVFRSEDRKAIYAGVDQLHQEFKANWNYHIYRFVPDEVVLTWEKDGRSSERLIQLISEALCRYEVPVKTQYAATRQVYYFVLRGEYQGITIQVIYDSYTLHSVDGRRIIHGCGYLRNELLDIKSS